MGLSSATRIFLAILSRALFEGIRTLAASSYDTESIRNQYRECCRTPLHARTIAERQSVSENGRSAQPMHNRRALSPRTQLSPRIMFQTIQRSLYRLRYTVLRAVQPWTASGRPLWQT